MPIKDDRVVAWVGRHINDSKNDRHLLIFIFENEAIRWRDQYKAGYAWLDELVVKDKK